MQWETLADWIWAIYYLFFITTLGTAVFSIVKKDNKIWSIVVVLFTITVPIVTLINSIGRSRGLNEFEYLVSQLQHGAFWSIFVIIGYFFLLGWWGLFLFKIRLINNS
ncbi:hypothetical protein [Halobacillus karajensis]|uniref:Integral membrane protein n=1 Tax=Halobacillus karajensis TaxID=195088 RepID=A0A024PA67_9BACI|nr:hypothetical protein [Halobacillus karajensis]CDQ20035.1 hypothetical protein BN982_02347 [Halobacillus karajensis]CDQ25302.1 hypothetical protein BN983_03618 [Halobacillus karajensis]CDQ28337.1 hypothetical protein BN981_02634 [Halobacillus karajensis]